MTQLGRLFSEHPASVGESYLAHLRTAGTFALRLFVAGLACLVHAVLPFLFVHTGSECISRLHQQMLARRRAADSLRRPATGPSVPPVPASRYASRTAIRRPS